MWLLRPKLQLLQTVVFRLLVLDVGPDRLFIAPDRGDEKPASPEALADEIPFPLTIYAGNVDRALALDEPDHLRHRVFRRNHDQHMHVIRLNMPLLDPAFLLQSQLVEDFPKVPSNMPK